MIAAFVRAEIGSPRFSQQVLACLQSLSVDRAVVDEPRLDDVVENAARRSVLAAYRGYNNCSLFARFPKDVQWARCLLDSSELGELRYANYDYFVSLTGGSRRVA